MFLKGSESLGLAENNSCELPEVSAGSACGTTINVRGLTISPRPLTVDRHSDQSDIHLKDEGGVKEFSAWRGNVFSFVAFLSFFDKCSSCVFHLCAVLSKGESIQTTYTVFRGNFLADQRSIS